MTNNHQKSERLALIESKARAYARSGDHRDFSSIEALLIIEGYSEARKLFANRWTQEELNRICRQACEQELEPFRHNALLKLGHSVSSRDSQDASSEVNI
jgi:hypothetical protein